MDFPKLGTDKTTGKRKNKLGDVHSLEISTVENKNEELWLTVDSGVFENVISPKQAPNAKVRPSEGSIGGVKYVTANGEVIDNQGEKVVKVVTNEGQRCKLTMQVTDVSKPLMSVSRICDAGHQVVFKSEGGYIEHLNTGQRTNFNRVDNVYRLQVRVANEPGFTRQGS